MENLTLLFNIFQIAILIILGAPVIYIFIFAIAGLMYRQRPYPTASGYKKIAILIPAYKEDEVIIEVAEHALQQEYPSNFYEVIIIADSFRPQTLEKLRQLPIRVIEVHFEKSTKAKALNKAMEELTNEYEIGIILDADNIMEEKFLSKVNKAFEAPISVVQGHRTAKNLNNSMAILDAVSEEINNHIFRKGHYVLGLSAAIIGSGMAFKYHYLKSLMATVTAIGGFDKEIELKMLRDKYRIAYLDDAMIYDEKVQMSDVFSNQRRRWLSAQFFYLRKYFLNALKHLILKQNIDYFSKALQFIQPPRAMLIASVFPSGLFFLLIDYFIHDFIVYHILWIFLIILCLLAFLFSIPRKFYNYQTLRAILRLPVGILLMLNSFFKLKGANKQFIHTKHGTSQPSTVKDEDRN